MENIFPFLIGLAVLAFNIYNNFRKEQDKARKRNPSAPETHHPDSDWKPVKKQRTEPRPELVEEVMDPVYPYEPKYRPVYKETVPPKITPEPKYETVRYEQVTQENKNPELPVAEVKRSRLIHQPHQHQVTLHSEEEEAHPYADFDFKDAIVKEAILNRPQH